MHMQALKLKLTIWKKAQHITKSNKYLQPAPETEAKHMRRLELELPVV